MNKKRKVIKILLNILIVLLLAIIIIFTVHKIKSKIEYNELKEAGYINKYSAGDYDLNIYRTGNGKHKIIAISGLGVHDYSVRMSLVNDKLKYDGEIIYIDRAGYGFSDDTSKKQTVKQIVSDYRKALKKAGIKGPYILMPHSIGGVYATYWESTYPEEIEGVIIIDGTEIGLNILEKKDYKVGIMDYINLFGCKLGIQRLEFSNFLETLPSRYTKKYQKYSDFLNIKGSMNKAPLSEIKEKNNNINKAYKSIKKNDIPKVYISATNGARTIEEFKEQIEWVTKRKKELGLKGITKMPTDKKLKKVIEENKKREEEKLKPYTESLGNTEIVLLPGDHYIFEQKPDELANIIKSFIKKLDQ